MDGVEKLLLATLTLLLRCSVNIYRNGLYQSIRHSLIF